MTQLKGKQIQDSSIRPIKLNLGGGYYPVNDSDVVNKYFIDSFTGFKNAVRITTISNIASILTANQATVQAACDLISSIPITLSVNNRVLVISQTNLTENGIYTWNGTNLVRSSDLSIASMFIDGSLVYSHNGDTYGNTYFYLIVPSSFTLGSSSVIFNKLNNTINFFDVSTNLDLTSLNANKGDISFVGSTLPKNTWILTQLPSSTLANWRLLGTNNFSISGSIYIGNPTDGQYGNPTSITGIQAGDLLEDALDKIDTFLGLIAPTKGLPLTGVNLVWNSGNPTRYQGKLSTGLGSTWYLDSNNPGDTVDVIYNPTFSLSVPTTAGIFDINSYANRSTWGIATLNYNNASDAVVNIAVASQPSIAPPYNNSTSNATLSITSVNVFNSIWTQAKATLTNLQILTEGTKKMSLTHNTAGTSNALKVFYQNTVPVAPLFSTPAAAAVNTAVYKLLSGIQYFTIGSQFQLSYTAATGIFDRTYHPTNVSNYQGTGFTTTIINPTSAPAFNDQYSVNQAINCNVINQSTGGSKGTILVTIQKTNNTTATSTVTLSKAICTYGVVSTNTEEYFFDEDKRLLLNTNTPYDSSVFDLVNDAQVRNGNLVYPNATDYSPNTFTGNREYQRIFTVGVTSSGTFEFGNLNQSSVSPYGTGDINILVMLDNATNYNLTTGTIFDLGKPFGTYNGNGNGDTRANSIGAKVTGSSTGTHLAFSFGTFSTALNSNKFRIIIIFRNNNQQIQKLIFS